MRSGKVMVASLLILFSSLVTFTLHFVQKQRPREGVIGARKLLQERAQGIRQYAPLSNVKMKLYAQAVRILLGLRDEKPSTWAGSFKLSEGELISVEPWRTGSGDVVNPDGTFKLNTRQVTAGVRGDVTLVENGIVLVLDAPPAARIDVSTDRGDFSFTLGDLAYGKPVEFLNGQAQVELVPCPTKIADTGREEDYPAAASSKYGTVLVYVEHDHLGPPTPIDIKSLPMDEQGIPKDYSAFYPTDGGDRVMLSWFDGNEWAQPEPVTGEGLDVWRPTVTIDGRGVAWVVWSENIKGNWELMCRRFDLRKRTWSKVERLTSAPGADINACAITSPVSGDVWVAWQGWRNDDFQILAMRLSEGAKGTPVQVGAKNANEWSPAIAADGRGNIYVAFDTYERGDHDIRLWMFKESAPDNGRVVAVTDSPAFEASPSIACDTKGRVWIAWEMRSANWGKDQGAYYGKRSPGTQLYAGPPMVRVACYADGQLQWTATDPAEAMPKGMRNFLSYPRVCVDNNGRVWLSFRRRMGWRGPVGTYWQSFLTSYDGGRWTEATPIIFSDNLLDNRPSLIVLPSGELVVAYSGDGRYKYHGPPALVNNALYVSVIKLPAPNEPQLVATPPFAFPKDVKPVHPEEKQDIARLRTFKLTIGGRTYTLMRGEFHRHTEISADGGGDGALEDMWRYALDAADLDWIGCGDHDNGGGREYPWWITQKTTDIFHHQPTFVPMFTYERSVAYPSGHRNVMFAQRGVRTLPRHSDTKGTPEAGAPDTKMLYRYLKAFDGICAMHTSATDMGTDWRDNDPVLEPVVELYQGCRQNYEYSGAPRSATKPEDSIGGWQPAGFVWEAFKKGIKFGYQASSDHISTHISYGVAFVEERSRKGLLEAFKKRHCYAATDNILLVVTSGNHFMGDEFKTGQPPRLSIYVVGTAPIARVHIIKDFKYVFTAEPKTKEIKLDWVDKEAKPGASWYYVRVEQEDGQLAWSSPMWIKYEP
ncbi:MAG: hypothetical protein RMK18_07230 [Armatimonadota bacterium]|nr:hypothetical protein [Armatimonadota bacterium]MCX7777926.1 hypothetical protein [Armatimonadota bacterium]MDW8025641.1 hypothetical protein [Armatimonadota bacterium]